jgi:hypothetical protein
VNANEYDPSDEGAPPGAPRPIKLTEEELAYYRSQINEAEILEGIREIEEGRGLKFEDFIGELEELARRLSEPTPNRD